MPPTEHYHTALATGDLSKHESHQPLSSTESDRLYRLATIEAQAADVFEGEQIAADWLKTPNPALDARPIDLLDS